MNFNLISYCSLFGLASYWCHRRHLYKNWIWFWRWCDRFIWTVVVFRFSSFFLPIFQWSQKLNPYAKRLTKKKDSAHQQLEHVDDGIEFGARLLCYQIWFLFSDKTANTSVYDVNFCFFLFVCVCDFGMIFMVSHDSKVIDISTIKASMTILTTNRHQH